MRQIFCSNSHAKTVVGPDGKAFPLLQSM